MLQGKVHGEDMKITTLSKRSKEGERLIQAKKGRGGGVRGRYEEGGLRGRVEEEGVRLRVKWEVRGESDLLTKAGTCRD